MLMRSLLGFLLFLMIPALVAQARDYPHAKTGVNISIPDAWRVVAEDDTLTANPRDESVYLFFIALEAKDLEAALSEMEKALSEAVTDLKENGEAEEVEINGMKGVVADATAMAEGVKVDLGILLLEAPKRGMYILAFGVGASGTFEKHEKDIERIFKSIKAIRGPAKR